MISNRGGENQHAIL